MEFWVIDRWEGDLAVCHSEEGKRLEIPRERFPENTAEGTWFQIMDNGQVLPSSEETKKRQEYAKNLRKCLLLR